LWNSLVRSGEKPYIFQQSENGIMAHESIRTARIEARISPDALAIVKRAAEIQGRSVSDFVVAAAQEAAERTIEKTEIIRLSVEGQRVFAEAILSPPEPPAGLRKAAQNHRRLIREVR
jgi:uncharacterized protein (DUF1778 family)